MTEEPKWPTSDEVVNHAHGGPGTVACYSSAEHAIDMCRVAWLASVDDPSGSPIGEVRQSPAGHMWARYRLTSRGLDWVMFGPSKGMEARKGSADVKGWPIIGSVPATPASALLP